MELLNDYDFTINYNPGKANKVADVLSRKFSGNLAILLGLPNELVNEIVDFRLVIVSGRLSGLQIRLLILEEIKKAQRKDEVLVKVREEAEKQSLTEFKVCPDGTLLFKRCTCIPDFHEIKDQLLEEAHQTPYFVDPRVTKMYHDLKIGYWWPGLKRGIIGFVEKCLNRSRLSIKDPLETYSLWRSQNRNRNN